MKRLLYLTLAFVALGARAAEAPRWTSILVTFSIEADGAVHMTERATVEIPPGVQKITRELRSDSEQRLTVDRLSRIDPTTGAATPIPFRVPYDGKVEWAVEDGTLTYSLETSISDGLIPAWSISRGDLTNDHYTPFHPKERFLAQLPAWREALHNPKRRYLLDVQYDMPPASEQTTELRFTLEYDHAWTPVHPISPDAIARGINADFYNPMRWRATHLFDYQGQGLPAALDVRRHAMRLAAILGFPIAVLLLWLYYLVRDQPRGSDDIDEQTLRDTLYNEPPEVIAARWRGYTEPSPRLEPFLRRLEAQKKVSLTIESDEDVSVRLLVPREQLTDYERAGIDVLMPSGTQVTSAEIREREECDPSAALYELLTYIAAENLTKVKAPWYARLTSLAMFAAGIWLCGLEIVRLHREPVMLAAGLVLSSATNGWPAGWVRSLIVRSRWWMLVTLAPAAVYTAAILFSAFAAEMPPGVYGSAGFSLMLLAACKAVFDSTTARPPRAVRFRRAELARARAWLQRELKSPTPRLDAEAGPWLLALGLRVPPQLQRAREENWGDSLVA